MLGSQWLLTAATAFAKAVGVSHPTIRLAIVAGGTHLPAVTMSVMAALRKERNTAVGNVIGSNSFNSLGLTGLVAAAGLLNFDICVMLAVAFACLPLFLGGRQIARWVGGVFMGCFLASSANVVLTARRHAAWAAFGTAMLSFVLPLTVVALVVVMLRPTPPAGARSP